MNTISKCIIITLVFAFTCGVNMGETQNDKIVEVYSLTLDSFRGVIEEPSVQSLRSNFDWQYMIRKSCKDGIMEYRINGGTDWKEFDGSILLGPPSSYAVLDSKELAIVCTPSKIPSILRRNGHNVKILDYVLVCVLNYMYPTIWVSTDKGMYFIEMRLNLNANGPDMGRVYIVYDCEAFIDKVKEFYH